MKLKKKHYEIAKTIAHFVDRNYYPDFTEPTREQIDIFTRIESQGYKGITEEEKKIVEPMINGKQQYDLQIKMIHEEIAEWHMNGWGWYYPLASLIGNVWKERSQCRVYVKMLVNLMRNFRDNGGLPVLVGYSGFDDEFKQLRLSWLNIISIAG